MLVYWVITPRDHLRLLFHITHTHDDVPIRSTEHVHLRQVSTTNHEDLVLVVDIVRRRDSRLPLVSLLQDALDADLALRRVRRRDLYQCLPLSSYSFLGRPLLAARRRHARLLHPLLVGHDLAAARRGLVREAPLAALHGLLCRGGGVLLGLAWGAGFVLPRLAKSNAAGGSAAQRGPRVRGAAYPRPGRRASLHSRVLTERTALSSPGDGGGRARRTRHDARALEGGVEGGKPVLAELDDREAEPNHCQSSDRGAFVARTNRHHGSQPSSTICLSRQRCVSSANNTQTEQPPLHAKKSISPNLKAKLLQEAESPWRTVRKFIYGAFALPRRSAASRADAARRRC